jgi:hypothetical protein
LTGSVAAGLGVALASAAALNWGFYAQHGAASTMPSLAIRRPLRSLRLLFTSPRWVLGFVTGLGGWALYVLALALAPLSLVQAVSAGGVGALALFVGSSQGLSRREWLGVGCAVAGLVLLGASLSGHVASGTGAAWPAVALWVGASACAALLAPALVAGAAGFGLAAGTLYAAGDVATKAATSGSARLAFVPVVLACHGLAFVCLQLGFQRGGALASAGLATLLTNALPILAGMTLFDEGLPGGARGAVRVLAFVAVVAGAAVLAAPEHEVPALPQAQAG